MSTYSTVPFLRFMLTSRKVNQQPPTYFHSADLWQPWARLTKIEMGILKAPRSLILVKIEKTFSSRPSRSKIGESQDISSIFFNFPWRFLAFNVGKSQGLSPISLQNINIREIFSSSPHIVPSRFRRDFIPLEISRPWLITSVSCFEDLKYLSWG